MKPISILYLLFSLLTILDAQQKTPTDSIATYPLQVGNLWQYWTYDYLNGQYTWIYGWTERVVGDTSMSNGQKYAIIKSDKPLTKILFLRQDINKVFQFNNGKDSLIYDFNKHKGDTILVLAGGVADTMFVVIKDERYVNLFSQNRKLWEYHTFFSKITYYETKDIVNEIGMGYLIREGGDEWFLKGAIINGVKYGTITSVKEKYSGVEPTDFELFQNYPNPFNPTTTISYGIPDAGTVHLTVYDNLGREVATVVNEYKNAGYYQANFDAGKLSSGMYFYKLQAGNFTSVRKMQMVK